jgi:putative glutamine amidotransferase
MKPRIAIPVPHSESDYAQRALPPYLKAIDAAGGEPRVVELALPNAEIARLATQCDAVLLPGSRADIDPEKYGAARDSRTAPADPARDNADELLLQDAYNMRKPVFGICYGLQSLNVWRTGTLLQHVENHSPGRDVVRAHPVKVEGGSRLSNIVGVNSEMWVNSSHHQVADAAGDGLRVVARAGDGVIEALEGLSDAHYVVAVQWHPERTIEADEPSRNLFEAFIRAAQAWHEQAQSGISDFESVRR